MVKDIEASCTPELPLVRPAPACPWRRPQRARRPHERTDKGLVYDITSVFSIVFILFSFGCPPSQVRATDGRRKLSTVVKGADLAKFQESYTTIMRVRCRPA